MIGKFEGKDLTHAWAGNVIDLCPVGALVSKDFLNKARSWELDRTASVCPNCSQGCNMIVETRDDVVVRLRPRPNEDVNSYYMCDHGRLNYRWMNRQDRVDVPMIRHGATLANTDWELAITEAARVLADGTVFVLASPGLPNEALFLLSQFAQMTGATATYHVAQGPEAPLPGVNDLSLRADRAANVYGAELLGFRRSDTPLAALRTGDVLVVADEELEGVDASDVAKASAIIVVGTTLPPWARHAVVAVLPIANMTEAEGTFTNLRGRVQRFLQAKAAPGFARPSWCVLGDLLGAVGVATNYSSAEEVFGALAAARQEFAGMSYRTLGLKGKKIASTAGPRGASA